MRKVIYCKYNLNRDPKFQTKTVIYQDGEERYIEKYALTEQADEHMAAFDSNYKLIKNLYSGISFIACEKVGEGIRYPYVVGQPLEEILKERIHSWDEVLPELKKIIEEVYLVNDEYKCQFEMTDDFKSIFGEVDCKEDVCICPSNVDVIFDNLVLIDQKITAFDYEWVCNFPVPEKYIVYRVLCRFYDKHLHHIEKHFTFDEFFGAFDLTDEEMQRFSQMEQQFIQYVYGNGDPVCKNPNYKKARTTLTQVKELKERNEVLEEAYPRAIEEYNKAIEVLHSTEKEYLNSIEQFNQLAQEKMKVDELFLNKCSETERLNAENVHLNNQLGLMEARAIIAENAHNLVLNSISWKITKPLRLIKRVLSSLKNDGVFATIKKIVKKVAKKLGIIEEVSPEVQNENNVGEDPNVKLRENLISIVEVSEEEQEVQRDTHFQREYKVSIITPLFNTPQDFLIEMIESVINQTYANWEFCMVNFSTTDFDRVDEVCRSYAEKDSRISYHVAEENKGISENTNVCLSYATGDFVGLLDHDDILHPCALYEVMKVINETEADFVYTDEIKFTETIKDVYAPNFKPDFSVDELRAHNFICHFNVYKTSLLEEAGMYRKEFDGSQDHDIVLRLTEKAKNIVHIPKILYYWRVHQNSVAMCIDAKPYATAAGENAVTEQLHRAGENQYVESIVNNIPCYRIRTEVEETPDVTIVIWNGKNEELVQNSLDSLQGLKDCKCIVLEDKEDSLGKCYNSILKDVTTKYVLFLCAGLQLRSETLVKEFMIYARRNDIATIDCRVISNTNTIYSGGTYLSGDEGMPVKLRCTGGAWEYPGYECDMYHTRAVVAATGLCTFVDVDAWKKSDGFMDSDSDGIMIEYSYRMWKNGFINLWIPYIEAINLDETMQQEYIGALSSIDGEYDNEDPYMSKYIIDLHLE